MTVAGVALLVAGLRGRRIEGGETCRRCGYDLRGRPAGASACAECGASLAAAHAIFRGTRRRRQAWITVGVVTLLAGLPTIVLDRAGALNERTLDRLTPTAWLLWRAEHGSPAGRGDALARAVLRTQVAPSRLSAGQSRRLVRLLIDANADPAIAWGPNWNRVIDAAILADAVPSDERARYFDQIVGQDVHLLLDDPIVRPGELVRLTYDHKLARVSGIRSPPAQRSAVWIARDVTYAAAIDGIEIGKPQSPGDGFVLASVFEPSMARRTPLGVTGRMPRDILDRLAPGPHTLRIDMTFDLVVDGMLNRGVIQRVARRYEFPVSLEATPTTAPSARR